MPRWDSLAKQRQAELCRKNQPWENATGPTTSYGKEVSSQNAKKHRRRQVTGVSNVVRGAGGDTLQVGDRVKYRGNFQPTSEVCGNQVLIVVGFFDSAIACRTLGGKLIWFQRQEDLERT